MAGAGRGGCDEGRGKIRRLADLGARLGLSHVALFETPNVAWLLGGADTHVLLSSERGSVAAVCHTQDAAVTVVTPNNEKARILEEELAGLGGLEAGAVVAAAGSWLREVVVVPWYEGSVEDAVGRLCSRGRLGSDVPVGGAMLVVEELRRIQQPLIEAELGRYVELSRSLAEAVERALMAVAAGMSEAEVAGDVMRGMQAARTRPVVMLVAADDRVARFRHPIPTGKRTEKLLMVATVGERWGLFACVTRMVSFGRPEPELERRFKAVRRVFVELCDAARPGSTYADALERAKRAYADFGFPHEWKLHHQGGPAGYRLPDFRATLPGGCEPVVAQTVACWNPTVTGAKTEDTVLIGPEGPVILSRASTGWPVSPEESAGGLGLLLPEILTV